MLRVKRGELQILFLVLFGRVCWIL